MKRKFTFLTATLLMLIFLAPPLEGWGQTRESYTITAKTGSGDGSGIETTTNVSDVFTEDTYPNAFTTATKAYYGGISGIKLGTSSAAGTLTFSLKEAGQVNAQTITVNAKRYSSSKAATINVNSGTAQSLTADFADYTFTINQEISSIQLDASKYCWISSITVTYSTGGGTTPEIVIPAAQLALSYEEDTDGNFYVTYNNFTPALAYATLYSDSECTSAFPTTGSDAWIVLDDYDDPYTALAYMLEANPTAAERTAYLKIEAMDDDDNELEAVFTITQDGAPTYTVTYDANGGSGTMTDSNSPYLAGATVTLLANTFTAPEGMMWDSWQVKDQDGNDVEIVEGMFEMPAKNVTVTAQWVVDPNATQYEWVETALADLGASDIFVIVGDNGDTYAMTNNNGTSSAPTASAVTVENGKITSTVNDNLKWNISGNATDGYTFYPNGSTTTWLYCTNTNNGVRVGNNNNKTFVINSNYLYHSVTSRHVGIYNSQDWRCYSPDNGNVHSNISGQTFGFYKRQVVSTDPSISASNVEIDYDATGGNIAFIVNNEVTGGAISASTTDTWITLGTETTSPITFTCSANTETTARTATVTLTYTYDAKTTVTKDVTITQAAAPVIYDDIEDLFNAATSTATEVMVSFESWFVTGVSTNGHNVFVTDGANGFVIHNDNGGLADIFEVNDLIEGIASASLKLNQGYAQLTNLDASDLTTTSFEAPDYANIAMANLSGINTGALVSYESLTCSVSSGKYYLSDGTTTLQVYNSLYAFGSTLEDGKTYNITGVYQQYSSTKEILPRSAADIVEVEIQLEEYTLTVSTLNDHINAIFVFNAEDENNPLIADGLAGTVQVLEGTDIIVSPDVADGYVLASLTVLDDENISVQPEDHMSDGGYYSFTMPSGPVTISATAMVAPPTFDYELYSGALVEGDYLIVYDGSAMNNVVSSNRLQYETVTPTNDVISTSSTAIVWHIAPSGDYWTIYSADVNKYAAGTGAKNKAQMLTDGTDDKAMWTVTGTTTFTFVNKANTSANVNAYLRNNKDTNGNYGFACYAESTGGALSLYKKVETTFTLDVAQYTSGQSDGWYLIASPVSVDIATNTMVSGTYDLYRFNPTAELEWENYKNTEHSDFTTLEVGRGYLYANGNNGGIQLSFTGVPANNGAVTAAYTGWNLVGNPLSTAATVDKDYYRMNAARTGIMTDVGTGTVALMEGIFVQADADESITFTPSNSKGVKTNDVESVVLNLMHKTIIDRAVVRFNSDRQLGKLTLFEDDTKIYFPKEDADYAIVSAEAQGEMPVNFRANENGTYTITVSPENVEMNYLHLIDNMTGADVDLLAEPSYTFTAKTTDYESRFRLVFSANEASGDACETSFAFFSNGQLVVSNEGEATLQVVDMLGRIVSSETVNGSVSKAINQPTGVYMIRLINGENVKVQKMVVK